MSAVTRPSTPSARPTARRTRQRGRLGDRGISGLESDGPLEFITIGSSLTCAVDHWDDALGSCFADTACGTFLATGGTLYGPQHVAGSGKRPQPRKVFDRLTQKPVVGSRLAGRPTEGDSNRAGRRRCHRTDRDGSYTVGQENYRTDLALTNLSSQTRTLVPLSRRRLSARR